MGQLQKVKLTHDGSTRRQRKTEEIFKARMVENFSKFISDTKLQTQEAQRTPGQLDARNSAPRHVTFKPQKITDTGKNLERGQSERTLNSYKSKDNNYTYDFSEAMQARIEWGEIFKVLRWGVGTPPTENSIPNKTILQD